MIAEDISRDEDAKKDVKDLAVELYQRYNPSILATIVVTEQKVTPSGIMVEVAEQIDGISIGGYASITFDKNHNVFSATIIPCFELPTLNKEKMITQEEAFSIGKKEIEGKYNLQITQTLENTSMKTETWENRTYYEFSIRQANAIDEIMEAFFTLRIDVYTGEIIQLASNM